MSLQQSIDAIPYWWHSIRLGPDLVTPGRKSSERLAKELATLHLPDVNGKSVLDIGAWDGFFSFECEKRGASRIVALDHYSWSIDFAARHRYLDECRQRGVPTAELETVPGVWDATALPGKRGFDLARTTLNSRVESVVVDFSHLDTTSIGSFDVVLFLGVLYHLKDPLGGLERLCRLTREMAIIESETVMIPGYEDVPMCEFYGSDEYGGDVSNWWFPNEAAIHAMCRAAGFSRIERHHRVPSKRTLLEKSFWLMGLQSPKKWPKRYRCVLHAYK